MPGRQHDRSLTGCPLGPAQNPVPSRDREGAVISGQTLRKRARVNSQQSSWRRLSVCGVPSGPETRLGAPRGFLPRGLRRAGDGPCRERLWRQKPKRAETSLGAADRSVCATSPPRAFNEILGGFRRVSGLPRSPGILEPPRNQTEPPIRKKQILAADERISTQIKQDSFLSAIICVYRRPSRLLARAEDERILIPRHQEFGVSTRQTGRGHGPC